MSIVSVDNIQPIGSGTTVTVNKSVTLESGNTNITGVCTATSFVGGLPITGGADNRVITAASASAIQGESTLTYNGTNLTISNGNLVIGTAGKGIDFSAQTATSVSGTTVTSELLDHYEEGNWLPDIRGSSTAGTATYTSRNGRYVRIGRIVHAEARATAVILSSANGSYYVDGLPFTVGGTGYNSGSVSLYKVDFDPDTFVEINASGTTLYFLVSRDATTWTTLDQSVFGSQHYWHFTIIYTV